MQRNFWFCSLEEAAAFDVLPQIGSDNVTVETDYPHLDSTWPNSQEILWRQVAKLSPDDAHKVAWRNAARLFRHDIADLVVANPDGW